MIVGIGLDAVNIDRFKKWHSYSQKQLLRLFQPEEIEYCLASKTHSAERFAARFAAREAFFKAWNSACPDHYVPLLKMSKAISISHGAHKTPYLSVNWNLLPPLPFKLSTLLTLTHSNNTAIVSIILQKFSD